ncbi:MAG: dihydrodipicolinate reductase C-terminal domain-containing protein [Bacteroidales bacterium]
MKILLIGYGRMGREIEKMAVARGHRISMVVDQDNVADLDSLTPGIADVAIEFTTAASAPGNIKKCLKSGIPVISGTTGWNEGVEEIRKFAEKAGGTFLYASNFSIGVNVLFMVNRSLASVMGKLDKYNPSILEIHHTRKLDAPSGTAITLADDIVR